MAHEEADQVKEAMSQYGALDSDRAVLLEAMRAFSAAHQDALGSGEPMVFLQGSDLVQRDANGGVSVLRSLRSMPRAPKTYRLK